MLDDFEKEDLISGVYEKILNSTTVDSTNINFKSYLSTTLKNYYIDNYRKNIKRQAINNHFPEEYRERDSGEIFDKNEIDYTILIGRITKMLTKKELEIFSLYVEGYKYEEISEKHNMPLGTIKAKIHNIKNKIKENLNY